MHIKVVMTDGLSHIRSEISGDVYDKYVLESILEKIRLLTNFEDIEDEP